MIRMASPFKDPRTGIYHFRRVIPVALRLFFDGGAGEYKRSLGTRDLDEAKARYPAHAVVYEQKIASSRRLLLSDRLRSARQWVDDYLARTDQASLQRTAMKLAMLETGAFSEAHGERPFSAASRYDFGAPPSIVDLRDHRSRKRMLEAVSDLRPLPWLETLQRIAGLPSLQPIDWAITEIAAHAGVDAPAGSDVYEAIGRGYLDRLCAACAVRIEPGRNRIVPAPIIVANLPAVPASGPLPPSEDMAPQAAIPTISKVYEKWCTFATREAKLVDEWRTAIRRFTELNGDLPVNEITARIVRDYRRTCSGLPSRAPKAISKLPLREQVEIADEEGLPTLAPDTVNKALSCIRVTLEHAVEELEVIEENVARGVKSLPRKETEDQRLPFTREDMQIIFHADLPQKDDVSEQTLEIGRAHV